MYRDMPGVVVPANGELIISNKIEDFFNSAYKVKYSWDTPLTLWKSVSGES